MDLYCKLLGHIEHLKLNNFLITCPHTHMSGKVQVCVLLMPEYGISAVFLQQMLEVSTANFVAKIVLYGV